MTTKDKLESAKKLSDGLRIMASTAERVSTSMFIIMYEVYLDEGLHQTHYAETTGYTLANVSRHIQNLVSLGFVLSTEPEFKTHGRTKVIHLTKEGREFCDKVLEAVFS